MLDSTGTIFKASDFWLSSGGQYILFLILISNPLVDTILIIPGNKFMFRNVKEYIQVHSILKWWS